MKPAKKRKARLVRRPPEKPKGPKHRKPVKPIRMIIKMRKRAKLTRNALAEASYIDPKYLWNLEHGISRNPGRRILIDLTRALVAYTKMFSEEDVDKVLKAAGYPPAPLPEDKHNRV
jgi:transcriptional regulator with XRE-family HTH domain